MDLFSRLEFFFRRLEKYIEVQPTAAMKSIIVKIMTEVLPILGIVTKEVGLGRTSMSFPVDISSDVDRVAEARGVSEKADWKEGCGGIASAVKPIDSGVSHGRSGSSRDRS